MRAILKIDELLALQEPRSHGPHLERLHARPASAPSEALQGIPLAKAPRLLSLGEVDERPDESDFERDADRRLSMDRLLGLIHRLKPLDRQVVLLYLEGLDAASIGEVTGSSPGSIATKIRRLKKLLTRQFQERGRRGE